MAHVERHHRKPCGRSGCTHGFAKHGRSAKGACTVQDCGCSRWKSAKVDRETLRARWRDPSGKEHAKTFTRMIDANRFLARVEGDKLKGSYVDPDAGRTLFRVVAERWYATTKGLGPQTRRDYRSLLDVWVLPRFGALPVASVDTLAIEEWLADASSRLSPSRARRAYYVLRGVRGASWTPTRSRRSLARSGRPTGCWCASGPTRGCAGARSSSWRSATSTCCAAPSTWSGPRAAANATCISPGSSARSWAPTSVTAPTAPRIACSPRPEAARCTTATSRGATSRRPWAPPGCPRTPPSTPYGTPAPRSWRPRAPARRRSKSTSGTPTRA